MKKYLLWSLFASSIFLFSCEDETADSHDTNSDEAKLEIDLIASQASDDIIKLSESNGVKGALDLLYLLEDFDFNARRNEAESVRKRLHVIANHFVFGPSSRVGNNDDFFTFEDIKGLYEWNSETNSFEESPSEFFIVLFPTEGSAENNAELKISSLDLVTITDDYDGFTDEYQLPSAISAYLKIDEDEVIRLDYLVDWSSQGMPEKADVELLVSPFTFVLGFDQTFDARSASLVTSVELDGAVILGVDVDVEFETDAKEELSFVKGFVQYYNLKIAGNVTVPTEEEEENGDINDFIALELLLDNEKIGVITFEDDLAYVVYSDGSKELLEEIVQPVLDDIEELFEDFEEED